jgi:epoxyqueuosine reductase
LKEQIRQRALDLGFDDCRFTTAAPPAHAAAFENWLKAGQHGAMGYLERNAFKRIDPEKVLASAKSIIVLAASYFTGAENGAIARYARFGDYHGVLAERLKPLTDFVNQLGGSNTRSLWYVDTGPLLERDLAQRAGLGFAGKHTNLISRTLGNWFFLSEIITTLALDADAPEKNRCGSCTRCIDACPTRAITAPFQLDARRCISYLTIELKGAIPEELRPAIGSNIYGCDICLEVCPWNRFAQEGRLMREHRRADLDEPALLDLLALDELAFKAKFRGTPILRTKRRGLLRNVCVALGNIGTTDALSALERAALDPEPLIAENARWAISRIELRLQKPPGAPKSGGPLRHERV